MCILSCKNDNTSASRNQVRLHHTPHVRFNMVAHISDLVSFKKMKTTLLPDENRSTHIASPLLRNISIDVPVPLWGRYYEATKPAGKH